MARNTSPVTISEERSSSGIQKDRVYLRDDSDGFAIFANEGPNDHDLVEDSDGFWMMTDDPESATTAAFYAVGGFILFVG